MIRVWHLLFTAVIALAAGFLIGRHDTRRTTEAQIAVVTASAAAARVDAVRDADAAAATVARIQAETATKTAEVRKPVPIARRAARVRTRLAATATITEATRHAKSGTARGVFIDEQAFIEIEEKLVRLEQFEKLVAAQQVEIAAHRRAFGACEDERDALKELLLAAPPPPTNDLAREVLIGAVALAVGLGLGATVISAVSR